MSASLAPSVFLLIQLLMWMIATLMYE